VLADAHDGVVVGLEKGAGLHRQFERGSRAARGRHPIPEQLGHCASPQRAGGYGESAATSNVITLHPFRQISRGRPCRRASASAAIRCYGSGAIFASINSVVHMAHYRKSLAAAVALNSGIFVVEAVAGFAADSLSLVMDGVHNLSDELALILLYLAFVLPQGISRHLLRSANLFNSVGLVLISALLLWQAVERILIPGHVLGSVAIVVGVAAAAANWGVARMLLQPSRNNAAIRLAYIHNIGDVYVSLAPVAAGLLVTLSSYSIFDPLIAGAIAVWIIVSTAREVFASSEELIWPEKIDCGHSNE
jgi:cobalt-zinc-cadmium efflux system protein